MYKYFTVLICRTRSCISPKFLLAMKLTIIIWMVALIQVSASSRAQNVSINVKNAPIEKIFDELTRQSGYHFLYDVQTIKEASPITLSVNNLPLKQVLPQCFVGQPFTYVFDGKDVIIRAKPVNNEIADTTIKQIKISGVVKDSTGEALVGVSVKLKNTQIGTVTDIKGKFSIATSTTNNVLVFSYIGYSSKEVTVPGSAPLNIVLHSSTAMLQQVVISVGYGKQKKAYVTGAVASANLEAVKDAPNTNIIQSLQGNLPGLNIGPVTSAGATPSITVRSQNTISGSTNVLIILDGIQYNNPLSSINPDDIASVEVLKDASSTAVYGAQAANGVLLITSRKGKVGGSPRINFTTSYATQTPSGNIRPYTRQEYLDKIRDLYWDQAYLAPSYTQPNPAFNLASVVDISMRNGNNISTNDFDWYNAATKQGFINNNFLSVSGGTEKINYLISGDYTNQAGYIINDLFKRKSLRVNLESQATPWLKLGVQSFGSFVNQDGAEPGLLYLFEMSPLVTPYKADGSLNPYPFNTVDPNPFLTYDVSDYERHNYLFANIYGELNLPFIPGLTYRVNFGNNGREDLHYGASKYDGGLTGRAYKNNENYSDYTLDNILTYSKKIKKHNFLLTAVYGAIQRNDETTSAVGVGFNNLTLGYNNIGLATTQQISSGGYQESLNYYMGRVNYAYDGKYLLTATIRRDGFSGFAANNKWGTFPSGSLGWLLSEEEFIKRFTFISSLKLRVGYGVAGNQTQRYNSLDKVTSQPAYVFGDGGSTVFGSYIGTLANPDLKWEKTSELNLGLDFSLLNYRITGSLDVYSRRTRDLLFSVQLPNITGFSSVNTNVGEIGNNGFELNINSKNIESKDFQWNTTFNLSRNQSKVISLLGSGDLTASNLFIGQPLGAIYGYKTAGIYQIGDAIPAGYFPGTYRVVDYNNDGVVNANDRYVLGSSEPAYRFSFINSLQYKNFTFSFLINSIQGGKNGYLGSNAPSLGRSDNTVRFSGISGLQYWTPTHPDSPFPLYTGAAPTISPSIYYSRSFIRLQDVTLSYKLSNTLLKKLNLAGLSVFMSGKNLKTWTDWKGWDPETGQGLITDARPLLVGWSAGLNVTF